MWEDSGEFSTLHARTYSNSLTTNYRTYCVYCVRAVYVTGDSDSVTVAGNFSNKPYLKISINSPKKKNWKILVDTPTEIFVNLSC